MIRLLLASILTLCSTAAIAQGHPEATPIGPDRAVNGGFQQGGWAFEAVNGCQATGEVTKAQAHGGAQLIKITNKSAYAPNVYGRAFQVIFGLEPFTTYRLSCYVKGKNVGTAWIGGGPGWFHRQRFPEGAYYWKYVRTLWTTQAVPDDYELIIAVESPTEARGSTTCDSSLSAWTRPGTANRGKVQPVGGGEQKGLAEADRQNRTNARRSGQAGHPVGIHVAQRFLNRVTSLPPAESLAWSTMQLEEIGGVLDETQKQIDLFGSQGARRGRSSSPRRTGRHPRRPVLHGDRGRQRSAVVLLRHGTLRRGHEGLAGVARDGGDARAGRAMRPHSMNQDGTLLEPARSAGGPGQGRPVRYQDRFSDFASLLACVGLDRGEHRRAARRRRTGVLGFQHRPPRGQRRCGPMVRGHVGRRERQAGAAEHLPLE